MSSSATLEQSTDLLDDGPEAKKQKLSILIDTNNEDTEHTQEYDLDETREFDIGDEKNKTELLNGAHRNHTTNGNVTDNAVVNKQNNPFYSGSEVKDEVGSITIPGTSDTHDTIKPYSVAKVESVQRDALAISAIIPEVDTNDVYNKILEARCEKNRIELITNNILESMSTTVGDVNDEIFEEVTKILKTKPNEDPSYVYSLLEEFKDQKGRVEKVYAKLNRENDKTEVEKQNSKTNTSESASLPVTSELLNDPAFKKNPLYKDLKTLVKVLPAVDHNELYAYLEAHFDKPNRVQIVIDELTKTDSQESVPLSRESSSLEDVLKGKGPQTTEDKLQADFKALKEIFRDCDPNYLYEKLILTHDNEERVHVIASNLFEKRDYPKLKDVMENEQQEKEKRRITEMDFDMKTFLLKFPDPFAYFNDLDRNVNQNYHDHMVVYLKNTYPQLKAGYIKKIINEKKGHLLPAILEIDSYLPEIHSGRGANKLRRDARHEHLSYPENPDEPFFQELLYYQHMDQINAHLQEMTSLRQAKVSTAREQNELMECGCCFDDECLFEDMAPCEDGHLFCKECIRRSVESALGEARTKFQCLTGSCELVFPLNILQEVLTPSTFSLALRKLQEEEIQQAQIPDLVACPFCSFATIMPDENDKVFKCLNPECLKESCRLCKELNHVPLRCNEVEKQGVTSLRTFIETKVSESMLRTCSGCQKRFFKQYGCNKMTCSCGATMCYVCRMPNIDYDHFNDNPNCDHGLEADEIHRREMRAAADEALKVYLEDHPDIDPANLDVDIGELVEGILKNDRELGRDSEDDDDEDDY